MPEVTYIAVGNEILLGKTINSNESFIGSHLARAGIPLISSSTIMDTKDSIINTLRSCWDTYDVIIMTGGLGPTHDDVTKDAICDFFRKELVTDPATWMFIQQLYANKHIPIPEIVKAQAEIPQGFTALPNRKGTAPGLYYTTEGKHFFALPGVPSEMENIFIHHVVPLLKKNFPLRTIFQKTIRTIAIPESVLYSRTKILKETARTKIAFLPKPGLVDIRVYGTSEEEVAEIAHTFVEKIPSENIYGYDQEKLPQIFHKNITASNKTLSAAESCTGGLIQSLITDNAGSSQYFLGGVVSYSNEAKMKLLGVKKSTLEKFGAVSEETVREMVLGVKELTKSDYAIAVSGIAGPEGGTPEKPVGLVYIGTWGKTGMIITKNNFSGTRIEVKTKTAYHALHQLDV